MALPFSSTRRRSSPRADAVASEYVVLELERERARERGASHGDAPVDRRDDADGVRGLRRDGRWKE
jgi:hypothetical protein